MAGAAENSVTGTRDKSLVTGLTHPPAPSLENRGGEKIVRDNVPFTKRELAKPKVGGLIHHFLSVSSQVSAVQTVFILSSIKQVVHVQLLSRVLHR